MYACSSVKFSEGHAICAHEAVTCRSCFLTEAFGTVNDGAIPCCLVPTCNMRVLPQLLNMCGAAHRPGGLGRLVDAVDAVVLDAVRLGVVSSPPQVDALQTDAYKLLAFVFADRSGNGREQVFYQPGGCLNPDVPVPADILSSGSYVTLQLNTEIGKLIAISWRNGNCYTFCLKDRVFAAGRVTFFNRDNASKRRERSVPDGGVFQRTRSGTTQQQYEEAQRAAVTNELRKLRVMNLIQWLEWADIDRDFGPDSFSYDSE
jgi:hypothetical protein